MLLTNAYSGFSEADASLEGQKVSFPTSESHEGKRRWRIPLATDASDLHSTESTHRPPSAYKSGTTASTSTPVVSKYDSGLKHKASYKCANCKFRNTKCVFLVAGERCEACRVGGTRCQPFESNAFKFTNLSKLYGPVAQGNLASASPEIISSLQCEQCATAGQACYTNVGCLKRTKAQE